MDRAGSLFEDKNGESYELRDAFAAYMRFGGMPGIADIGLDQEKALLLPQPVRPEAAAL